LDELILLIALFDPCNTREASRATQEEITQRFVDAINPFFVIYDVRGLSITFEDVFMMISDAVYMPPESKSLFEKYGRMLIVGTGPLISLIVVSAGRFLPTRWPVKAFETPEEALEYAHSQLAE
jgi:hypothetical protein